MSVTIFLELICAVAVTAIGLTIVGWAVDRDTRPRPPWPAWQRELAATDQLLARAAAVLGPQVCPSCPFVRRIR